MPRDPFDHRMRPLQSLFLIEEASQVGNARRGAAELAASLGFDDTQAGKVGIAINECGTNILKHAGRGRLLLNALETNGNRGIEILALDKGPGIANLQSSLRDGYSTTGTMGGGLGALSRIADGFQVFTQPGRGAALRVEIWNRPWQSRASAIEYGGVCLAKPGEPVAGDAWGVELNHDLGTVLVADGLGHGLEASTAARAAMDVLTRHSDEAPHTLIEECHSALARTRGAAVAAAKLSSSGERGSYAAVGNIVGRVEGTGGPRNLLSYNGIVGHTMRKLQEVTFSWPRGALLVMHSDGLGTHWQLGAYPGLAARHPSLIAAVLYRDYDRGNDDVSVVVLRNRGLALDRNAGRNA